MQGSSVVKSLSIEIRPIDKVSIPASGCYYLYYFGKLTLIFQALFFKMMMMESVLISGII